MLDRGLREGPEEQSVPGLEPDVLGELLAAAGAGGGNTEAAWWGHQDFGGADRGRPGRSDGSGTQTGSEGRGDLPSGLVRLPSRASPAGRGGGLPAALLENRLGDRSGNPEVLRQRSPRPDHQGGGGEHRSAVGSPVREAVAGCAGGEPRRHGAEARPGYPTRVSGVACAG